MGVRNFRPARGVPVIRLGRPGGGRIAVAAFTVALLYWSSLTKPSCRNRDEGVGKHYDRLECRLLWRSIAVPPLGGRATDR